MLEMEKKEQESLEKAKRYAAQKKELLKRKKAEESKKRDVYKRQPISTISFTFSKKQGSSSYAPCKFVREPVASIDISPGYLFAIFTRCV